MGINMEKQKMTINMVEFGFSAVQKIGQLPLLTKTMV